MEFGDLPLRILLLYSCFMAIEIPHPSETIHSGPAWRAAEAYGCDMDLLAESLALTPAERLRLHTIALRRIEQLEAATKRARDGFRSPA
jgi:hypothetical protein